MRTQRILPSVPVARVGTGEMVSWIRQVVGFGTRRPGYRQSLAVENWLEEKLREFGLREVRLEPVPVNRWEPEMTSLFLVESNLEIPCFPIPYTAWTPAAGLSAPGIFIGAGDRDQLDTIDLHGKTAVLEAHFAELTGSSLKSGACFVRDANHSIPDGPLHSANWLIRNFNAYYEAQQRGAAAVVGLLVDSPTNGCEFYVPYDGHLKGLPAVWVGRQHAALMRDAARAGEQMQLVSVGRTETVDSHNVVGIAPGTGGGKDSPSENIIVTCHHDAPFASAVEDASGLAVLLALAREFADTGEALRRDLVFVISSGHFHGGIGNRVFVEKHAEGLLKRTVAAFGVEHIAQEAEADANGGYRMTGRPEVRALFFDGSSEFAQLLYDEAEKQQIDRMISADAYSFGPEPPCDSAPFFTSGIPSACHISGPLYLFDPQDTLDKVRLEDLEPVARFFSNVIRRVDRMSATDLAKGMKRPRGSPPAPLPPWFRAPG